MKKITLLLICNIAIACNVHAEGNAGFKRIMHFVSLWVISLITAIATSAETYEPILSEGKTWILEEIYDSFKPGQSLASRLIRVEIIDEATEQDKQVKVVLGEYIESGNAAFRRSLYEEEGKLYCRIGGNEYFSLLIDMTLGLNETVTDSSGEIEMKAIEVNTKNVNGTPRKELVMAYSSGMGYQPDFVAATWVEGVGSSSDEFITPIPRPLGSWYYRHLLECYDNGELIFTNMDFSHPIANLDCVEVAEKSDEKLFDLFGRSVTQPRKGSLYVTSGGRKIRY